jgi:hypothetical protein
MRRVAQELGVGTSAQGCRRKIAASATATVARHYSVAIGCQSSTRFPSGSVIQPNFPKS